MAKFDLKLNHAGMREVLMSSEVRGRLQRIADAMVAEARHRAPVESGEYRDSIHRESATTDRAVERVVASDRKSLVIEARRGVLGRTVRGYTRGRTAAGWSSR